MSQRCNNKNHKAYKNYGDRGIIVCERWLKFENFLADVGEPPTNKHTLDRIDNNRGYFPDNWKWSTRKEQANNRRNNILETFNDKTQCLAAWAEEYKLNYRTLHNRIYRLYWNISKALLTPTRYKRK